MSEKEEGTSKVVIPDETRKAMEDFKLKHAHKYVVFKWVKDEDESVIKLVATYKSKKKGTHKGFMKRLKKTEAVYVLYDYEDKRRKIKPYFVCWTPPNCGDRNTMLYLQERAKILTLVSSKSGEEILNGVKKISGKNDETIERELGHLEEEEELSDWDPDA